jgi:hypothetical protein
MQLSNWSHIIVYMFQMYCTLTCPNFQIPRCTCNLCACLLYSVTVQCVVRSVQFISGTSCALQMSACSIADGVLCFSRSAQGMQLHLAELFLRRQYWASKGMCCLLLNQKVYHVHSLLLVPSSQNEFSPQPHNPLSLGFILIFDVIIHPS